ncbi:MAG: cyclase family protein [Gammaproteobacteria bacterium]|nr:cyclase family protein [Gammaproteobacteria bacterium]MDD9957540.1 cyclase family protein [Gammaproteobacteria bacterium]
MRAFKLTLPALTLAVLALILPVQAQQDLPFVSEAQFEEWLETLNNWGRWGPGDEIGTLNLITPEKRKQAAALVQNGVTVSLARNLDNVESIDNPCPVDWEMANASPGGASDRIAFRCIHGPGVTHIDGYGHRFFDGKMWNGVDMEHTVTMEEGALINAVLNMKDGIITRGVLYDIPRLKGVDFLPAGYRVTVADLEAWEAMSGAKIGPGDAMLFRWGRWVKREVEGPFDTWDEAAGLDNNVIPWLRERDVAIIGWETPGYTPRPEGDLPTLALHDFALTMLGIPLIDRADLDALAAMATEQNRWEFMLTIAPLPIPNGTGSPVNPIAAF